MSDLGKLYQQIILDHNKNPRNFRKVTDANCEAESYNPLCGDRISVSLHVVNGEIDTIGFQGSGCAISKASASLMTEAAIGKTENEVAELFSQLEVMLHSQNEPQMGNLNALAGVRNFPVRIACAELAWKTLLAALRQL